MIGEIWFYQFVISSFYHFIVSKISKYFGL